MAKVTDFTQEIVTSYTMDNQFIAIRVTDSYKVKAATMDRYTYEKQDACVTGRFSWHGKCKIGVAWIVWRHIGQLDGSEVNKAIKIATIIHNRYNTVRDTIQSQDYAFWKMMEGKRYVRHGKGAGEWVMA